MFGLKNQYGETLCRINIARRVIVMKLCGSKDVEDLKFGKEMLLVRDLIKHQILWHLRKGNASVWYDNWTGLGDLYNTGEDSMGQDNLAKEKELVRNDK